MIVAGFGFRSAAELSSLQDALRRAASGGQRVEAIATVQDKARSPVFRDLAATTGLPIRPVAPQDLSAPATLTHSAASQTARDVGSVAEASALAAAGHGARLITARVISGDRMATCALAETPPDNGDLT